MFNNTYCVIQIKNIFRCNVHTPTTPFPTWVTLFKVVNQRSGSLSIVRTKNDPPFCTWCDVHILHNIGSTSKSFIETYHSYCNKTACKCSYYYYDDDYTWRMRDNLWKTEETFNYKLYICMKLYILFDKCHFYIFTMVLLWTHKQRLRTHYCGLANQIAIYGTEEVPCYFYILVYCSPW